MVVMVTFTIEQYILKLLCFRIMWRAIGWNTVMASTPYFLIQWIWVGAKTFITSKLPCGVHGVHTLSFSLTQISELLPKQKETHRLRGMNLRLLEEGPGEGIVRGVWDGLVHAALFKMDNQ